MISERLYRLIAAYASLAVYFGISPMEWCKTSRSLIPSNNALKKAYGNTILVHIWTIFLVFQLLRFHNSQDFHSFNIALTYAAGSFICSGTFSLIAVKEHDVRLLVNGLLFYLRHINGTKPLKSMKKLIIIPCVLEYLF